MPVNGGNAFPISYGDWDETNVRWSPDGKQLAFISNRHGNAELWLRSIPGSGEQQLEITGRKYLKPMMHFHVKWQGSDGQPFLARVSVKDQAGRFHAPAAALYHHECRHG